LIDEATANIDTKTDELIQIVIADKFQDRTVLTIAHRLNTVTKSDLILVFDKGMIVNFDTPTNILQHYQL
jgi:ABC-type multidrug transport system fused ATPase/permease subunit